MEESFDGMEVNISGSATNVKYDQLDYKEEELLNCTDEYCNGTYWDYDSDGNDGHMFYIILWVYVTPIIFGLICVVGICGNVLVIFVILSRPAMRTATNFLLLNLAFSDISFLIITVPFTAYKYASFSWDFGLMFCKFVQYFLYVCTYVTVWTLVAISGYRFLTVLYATKSARYRTKCNIIIFCGCIWGTSLGTQIPVLLAHKIKTVMEYSYCGLYKDMIEGVLVSFFVFGYALPLLLICLLYLPIMWHLRQNKNATTIDNAHARERTARACKVIILVVVVFCISWLPLHINSLVATYGQLPAGKWYEVFRVLWNCMAYGNSCANPFIYNYASHEFRKAFREVLCCVSCPRLRRNQDPKVESELTKMVVH